MSVELPPSYARVPYLRDLASPGIECDQSLSEAIRRALRSRMWNDAEVLYELAVVGSRSAASLDLIARSRRAAEQHTGLFRNVSRVFDPERREKPHPIEYHDPAPFARQSLRRIVERCKSSRRLLGCLNASAFIDAMIRDARQHDVKYFRRGFASDFLSVIHGYDERMKLQDAPELLAALHDLQHLLPHPDDLEFVLAVDSAGHLRVRVGVPLADCVQGSTPGQLLPVRAIEALGAIGAIERSEIRELEDLVNKASVGEEELQAFFEAHPHFFRRWDHRAVHPQVYLTREEDGDGPLIPDFILTNNEAQEAFVVDLKLPRERLIVRKRNRERFSAAIVEAKAQLLTYRDWFEDRYNRERIKDAVGMDVYRPQLSVIVGRSSEFRDGIDRAKLRSTEPDIEVVTYDDILAAARQRQVVLEHGYLPADWRAD